ncbi:MAG: glycosyltransferase [Stenomitos rutilans HA7619-LM2]|jgi:glycosyltransferase involved in cell wall biosynthesis|nr:glycosyltransferase [Stenomitos rutilans HA7619-LM2]
MKRILFISHDASRTGAPIVLLNFLRWFRDHTHLPFLILLREDGALRSEFEAIGPVIVLNQAGFAEETIAEQLEEYDVRLIYSNTIVNGMLLKALSHFQCPIISHVHELEQTIRYYVNLSFFQWVERYTTQYIVASNAVKNNLHLNHGIEAEKLNVIYEFIPIRSDSVNSIECKQALRTELAIPENAFIVGSCGTIEWRKGADIFVQLLRTLHKQRVDAPIYFLWVGGPTDSAFFDGIYADVKLLGLEHYIHFVGVKTDPLNYFAAFDVFALVSREDPFPLVCLEAASLGKPIVCFDDAGGMKEFVEEDCGFVVPYLNTEAMADRILELLDAPALRDRLGQQARRKVEERHDVNVLAPEILKLIERFFPEPNFAEIADRDTIVSILKVQCAALSDRFLETRTQLQHAQSQLHPTQSQLQFTQRQLQQTQTQLQHMQSQFQHTQKEFEQTQCQLQETQSQLQQAQRLAEHVSAVVRWMQTSKFWQIRLAWLTLRERLLRSPHRDPIDIALPSPPSVEKAMPVVQAQEADEAQASPYHLWQKKHTPRPDDLRKLAETIDLMAYKPLISVVMPVYNPPEAFLRAAIDSVIDQIYPHWELCLADDVSTAPYVRPILEFYQAQDSRIKVTFRTTNGHISRCSNSALELATGEFVALLDHDDLLTPDALYEVALLTNRHPEADLIYSDEDKLNDQDELREPYFKPDWCPDSFLSRMYICHLGVYRRSLLEAIGGFRPGFEGSQDYDLALRFTEKTDHIFHIPKILYHWRIHAASAASSTDAKPYAYQAAEKALTEAFQRRGTPGKIINSPTCVGHYMVRYQIEDYKLVSIIIPTKDLSQMLNQCLESIFKHTTYPNYEVIVIDNGSVEKETANLIDRWSKKQPHRFKCYPLDIPFNYSTLNNYAVTQAKGEFLLFLNNDTEIITPDWVNAMVEQAQRPSIGAVGVQLLYPDDTVQHAGVIAGLGGIAGHSHWQSSRDDAGYFNQLQTINNYSAVTAACLMCRRDVFMAVRGFEEQLAVAFNDVDFCFKMLEKGYRNIYLPHVKLYHYESKSRGIEDTPEKKARFQQETAYMQRRWSALIAHDPCYSPHLTRRKADYSLNI